MKILLTGGGTVSHVLPILLISKSLSSNKRNQLLYIGSRDGIENDLVKEYQIKFKRIIVGKKRSYYSILNLFDLVKTFMGIFQVYFIYVFFKPDVIFSKGGYVTVPVLFWAKLFKKPLVLHESDVVIGQANRWGLNFAKKICLGFPIENYKENISLEKAIYTGIPVKEDFLHPSIKSGDRSKILITGGTQGSQRINNIIFEILNELLNKYEIYHISGKLDYAKFTKISNEYYHLYDFTNQMPKIMRDVDLVISRSGASTMMEISAAGKASILIPLEISKGEHQIQNAKVFENKNAAVVLSEKNLSASSLLSIINNLMDDNNLRNLLAHHVREFYQPNAAEIIVETIFEAVK